MAEIVHRLMHLEDKTTSPGCEIIEVRAIQSEGETGNFIAAKLAGETLLRELPEFQPPIIDATEADIEMITTYNGASARYIHRPATLTGTPDSYTVTGYPDVVAFG